MSEIIDFAKAKEDAGRWTSGPALCLRCKHEWVAVAPVGLDWFECPECHCHTGCKAGAVKVEGPHYQCKCGNWLFLITPDGTYCPLCGEQHIFD